MSRCFVFIWSQGTGKMECINAIEHHLQVKSTHLFILYNQLLLAGNRRQRNHDKTERDTNNDVGGGASSTSVSTSESSKPVKKKAKTSRK